jgi:hypothetical protein
VEGREKEERGGEGSDRRHPSLTKQPIVFLFSFNIFVVLGLEPQAPGTPSLKKQFFTA